MATWHIPKPAAPRVDDKAASQAQAQSRLARDGAGVEDDDGAAARFAGQLHLSATERARRTHQRRGKPKPRRQSDQSRTGTGAHGFTRPTAPVVREVAIGDAITVADLAQKLALKGGDVVKALFKMGVMATITQTIDHDTAVLVVEELGHTRRARRRRRCRNRTAGARRGQRRATSSRVRRWSRSWATSTTARPRCSTTSAAPRSPPAKPAASPSTSARTTSKPSRGVDQLPRYAGPRGVHRRCARAAPSSPTSWCWWSRPTTA